MYEKSINHENVASLIESADYSANKTAREIHSCYEEDIASPDSLGRVDISLLSCSSVATRGWLALRLSVQGSFSLAKNHHSSHSSSDKAERERS